MPTDAHTQAIRALADLGPLRVWSVLVTVFGDLAPNDLLDGPTLSAIMSAIGIKPEATRVALHRLRSDGWIASQKRGRTSLHSLTEQGRRDSEAARPRIYGTPDQMGRGTYALIMPDAGTALDPALYAQIAPRVYLAADATPLPESAMQLAPMDLPPWLGAQLEPTALRDAYKALHAVLMDVDAELRDVQLTPLEVAVLRVMIVHAWRRLTLRHPDLPRASHSPDWRGHDCRALVTGLLTRFARPDLDAIKAA
ncbi:PaaX family transcriptional regulator C-terminal domain-containing protein [uncultured Tateyamaria sp.]|uniref:PaaX family transcriptional regulator C-terminal domain-containing protein n=1 Tax=uncultured Tateyamaria sp. TaxID=455651 RepID=UPI0026131FE6|nr:PaaX family transcriptional regulator C-terminal domain-containing protein [uncultured Tateyamaria sp.]